MAGILMICRHVKRPHPTTVLLIRRLGSINDKTLVTDTTRTGSTRSVAEVNTKELGRELTDRSNSREWKSGLVMTTLCKTPSQIGFSTLVFP